VLSVQGLNRRYRRQWTDILIRMGIVFGRTGVAEPTYDVLLSRLTGKALPYELRGYGHRYAIETDYAGKEDQRGSFMRLAGYIGVGGPPQNDGGEKIAMTAPVVTSGSGGGAAIAMTAPVVMNANENVMQFILPAEYDELSKIPKPTCEEVRVTQVAAAVGAVHQFSGWVKKEQAMEKTTALIDQLREDGASISQEEGHKKSLLWQYNPPFTIPFLRRNEIWVELSEEQIDSLKKTAENVEK